jgi:hypothetical protein
LKKNIQELELSEKTQIGVLDKDPIFVVERSNGGALMQFDFYYGNDLRDPLVNEDNTGKRAKGFIGTLWFGYGNVYQNGTIVPFSNYEKKETVNNSKGVATAGYFMNSKYKIDLKVKNPQ